MRATPGPYGLREDWLDRLVAEIAASRDRPFEWGQNDCLQWAGRCVAAMSGTNPLEPHRGRYTDCIGALRVLRRDEGLRTPVELADRLWGPRMPPAAARMGDLVAAVLPGPDDIGPSIGVCYGRNSLFVGVEGTRHGLVRFETLSLEHSYQPCRSSSRPSSP